MLELKTLIVSEDDPAWACLPDFHCNRRGRALNWFWESYVAKFNHTPTTHVTSILCTSIYLVWLYLN